MSTQMRNQNVAATQPVPRTSFQTRAVPQSLALIGGDVFSGLVAHLVVSGSFRFFGGPTVNWKVTAAWLALWLLWRSYQGLYPGYGQSPQNELRRHTVSTVQVAVAQLAAAFAVQRFAPSGLVVIIEWLIILLIGLPLRYGVRSLLIHFRMFGRAVSIIGAGETAHTIIAHLVAHPSYGLVPFAAYDDNAALHGQSINGVKIVGNISQALSRPGTEQAIIGIPSARSDTQQQLINTVYAVFPITWTVPDLIGVPNQAMQPHNIGSLASLEIKNNLRSVQARFLKRTLDLFLSIIGAVIISPILFVVALLVFFDSPGKILYRAPRMGRDGKTFKCLKFRSMYTNADERLNEIISSDPAAKLEYEAYHKLKDDPRVTKIGKVLRKYSLDELPQIFNVLRGEMSLVGPRPYLIKEQEKMGSATHFIVQVRPGMTGYWQVTGRSFSTFEERLDMDRFYITNWTPWLDLVIMLQTVRVVLISKGAY
ncbi:undecaprenyl-phosphate galactose phosphotransferase WbaP [Deinococcus altitudinis]|uniref:undecaprenyl-phosphate galactose phosphotransferase WbaP n=1 Tax=Deinococcus altitudinis TaxID=468914 RepID=UPI003892CBC7